MSESHHTTPSFETQFAAYQDICAQVVASPRDFMVRNRRHNPSFIATTHRNRTVLAEALRTGRQGEVFALYDDIAGITEHTREGEGHTFGEYIHVLALGEPIVDSLDYLIREGPSADSKRARDILEEGASAACYTDIGAVAAKHVVAATAERLPVAYATWQSNADDMHTRQLRTLVRAARSSISHIKSTPTDGLRDTVVGVIRALGPDAPRIDHPLDGFMSGILFQNEFRRALLQPFGSLANGYADAWKEGYGVDLLPNKQPNPAEISTDTYFLRNFNRLFDLYDADPTLPQKLLDVLNHRSIGRFGVAAAQQMLATAQDPGGKQVLLSVISRQCHNGAMLEHAEDIEEHVPKLAKNGIEIVVVEASSADQVRRRLETFDQQGHRFAGIYIAGHGHNNSWGLSSPDERLTSQDCATWLGPLLGKISLPGSNILTGMCWSAAGPGSPAKALHEHSGRKVIGTDGVTGHELEITPRPGQPPLVHARFFKRRKKTPDTWKYLEVDPVIFDYATLQP